MRQRKKPARPPLNWLANVVALTIVGAFIVCLIVSELGGPPIPPQVFVLLGIVAGGIFGVSAFQKK